MGVLDMQNLDKTEHNYLIDCFRILAISMVLSVHVRGYLTNLTDIINELMELGAYGVALYFIISGYFSVSSVDSCVYFKQYLKKKIIRIVPMYYFSLVLTFLIGGVITHEYPISWKWIYHVFFLNMFIPSKEWMWWNSVNFFWTMPAFMAWYVVSFFLLRKIHKARDIAVLTLGISVITPFLKNIMYNFASRQFVNWNFFSLIYVFLLGCLAYFVVEESKYAFGILYGIIIALIGLLVGNRNGFFIFGLFFYFMIILTDKIPFKWKNNIINRSIKLLSLISYD